VELGREARALRRLGAHTHAARQKMRRTTWAPLPGVSAMGDGSGSRAWQITELCSFLDLLEEGTAMRHCIVAYVPDCSSGRDSVWSLRCADPNKTGDRVTVRVCLHCNGVIEARGFVNAPISE